MGQWKVKAGTQVAFCGNLYGPGDTFEASDGEVAAEGFGSYVTKMKAPALQPEPVTEIVESAPSKALQSSSNKAQQSSDNKSK